MLNRTSSHIWVRWYLPMFLLRDGLLTYLYSLFYLSHEVLVIPLHYNEIFQCSGMTCDVIIVIYWGRGFKMFPEPLPKCFWWFSNILLITFHSVTLLSIDDTTCFGYVIFIFRCHLEVFDGFSSLKVHLYPTFSAYNFNAFTQAFWIRYH